MGSISRAERRRSRREDEKGARPEWATLDEFARLRIQGWLQDLLEKDITELLGRPKSARRTAVDAEDGYRNGHGKPRRLGMTAGTITVRRPRVRGLEVRFESRILPLFARRTQEVAELLPQLYLHGLAQGDFELALRGLLGEGAPLSPASIERLRAKWTQEYAAHAAARPARDRVRVGGRALREGGARGHEGGVARDHRRLKDGRKVVLAVESGQRESTARVLRDLRDRGLRPWKVTVADGHLGIWGALRDVALGDAKQRCWNHYSETAIIPRRAA